MTSFKDTLLAVICTVGFDMCGNGNVGRGHAIDTIVPQSAGVLLDASALFGAHIDATSRSRYWPSACVWLVHEE